MKGIKKGVPKPGPQERFLNSKEIADPIILQENEKDELFLKHNSSIS
jgi:hypothetical protein